MENKIPVSIIVPCYNIEKYIAKCVDSILAQTYTNFELLLIDDGSSDQTLDIIKSYAATDPRVVALSHANRGVSYTRNKGITFAKGDYIMFIDGDDFIKDDFVEQHSKYASKEVWPLSGMVNVRNGQNQNNLYFKKLIEIFPNHTINKNNILQVLAYYSLSSPCCRLYLRDTIIKYHIEFNEQVTYQEDLLFNLDYIKFIDSIQLIDYYGYFYVQHTASSSLKFHQNFDYNTELFEKLLALVDAQEDKVVVYEFIFQTFMKRTANIFHKESFLTKSQIKDKVDEVFNDPYYDLIRRHILRSSVNPILKGILFFKVKNLLYYYFNRKIHT